MDTLDAILDDNDLVTGATQGRVLTSRAWRTRSRSIPKPNPWKQSPFDRIGPEMETIASVSSMQRLLRTAGGDPEVIRALPDFHCAACAVKTAVLPVPTGSVSSWRWIALKSRMWVEDATRFSPWSAWARFTMSRVAQIVSPTRGAPSSRACVSALFEGWLGWAGPTMVYHLDRGAHKAPRELG